MSDDRHHVRIGDDSVGDADRFFGIRVVVEDQRFDRLRRGVRGVGIVNRHRDGAFDPLAERGDVAGQWQRHRNFYF